ncbi:MAG: alkaline phosphatase family protein, partial [Myxococcales bacterium]
MMQIAARRVYLVVACAAALVAPAVRAQGGRLVVFVVVDQLRYQDLLWARDELGPGGFGGLGQPLQARYRAALTHTAPDHATLATGTYPDVHGIVGNTLLDDGKPVEAIDDPACENWRGTRRQGPGKLLVPTVADALKLATLGRARALALSFKDRGALFLAGRAADLAPPSTTIVLRAADAGVAGMRLGDRGESDLLLVSLSGLDYVGHAYGTASRERLDMLLRMHDGLSEFVSRLRTKLGNRVAFV